MHLDDELQLSTAVSCQLAWTTACHHAWLQYPCMAAQGGSTTVNRQHTCQLRMCLCMGIKLLTTGSLTDQSPCQAALVCLLPRLPFPDAQTDMCRVPAPVLAVRLHFSSLNCAARWHDGNEVQYLPATAGASRLQPGYTQYIMMLYILLGT